MDLLLFSKRENSKELEEKLKKDDLVSGASIKVRDASIVNKDGVYFYLEGTEDKIKKAKELAKNLAEEVLGEEKEKVVKILKEEEERAIEGFGAILG
jgi:ribosomal protein L4